jgi:hypothetical protein
LPDVFQHTPRTVTGELPAEETPPPTVVEDVVIPEMIIVETLGTCVPGPTGSGVSFFLQEINTHPIKAINQSHFPMIRNVFNAAEFHVKIKNFSRFFG